MEALKGVDLEVSAGDFFGLLGPNGAGKTTLIGIITTLVNKTAGSVAVYGYDLDLQRARAKACIGVVPQEFNFNIFERPFDILVQQAGYYGIPRRVAEQRAERYLRELDLWDKRFHQARELSGGMKRRLMIARALVNEPRLLILDEPTAGVDIEIRRQMWEFMIERNRRGTTIILTTHYLEEAESLCRHLAIIDHGEILEHSSVKELIRRLDRQAYVLDTAPPLEEVPPLEGVTARILAGGELEVEVPRGRDLSEVFQQLSRHGVRVVSLRNRVNRLEELFVNLVGR